ncbi:MAG: hypothetical protein IT348_17280 [Candidatus Eisenbacteria bacterium]|nr:hypothetical protein [Candidatus Eisenbacteria bacterium]
MKPIRLAWVALFLLAASPAICRAELPVGATEADTSMDGRFVVYLRELPGLFAPTPSGDSLAAAELWFSRVDGSQPRVLLAAGDPLPGLITPMAGLHSPQFSPDGRRVYFTTLHTVTSDAVVALDLLENTPRLVCGANSLFVVRRGRYAGNLLVEQHRYRKGGGSYDWLYLVSPAGKRILTLGDSEDPAVRARANALFTR